MISAIGIPMESLKTSVSVCAMKNITPRIRRNSMRVNLRPYILERRMYHSYTKIFARTIAKKINVATSVCDSGANLPKTPIASPRKSPYSEHHSGQDEDVSNEATNTHF